MTYYSHHNTKFIGEDLLVDIASRAPIPHFSAIHKSDIARIMLRFAWTLYQCVGNGEGAFLSRGDNAGLAVYCAFI
jgi:hypothetical protein